MNIKQATILTTSHFYGKRGEWCYSAFEHINQTYFDKRLPWPLIRLELTAHGRGIGMAHTDGEHPIITLHPSAFGGLEKKNPWGIPPEDLGERYAYDVLLHECIHVAVNYVLGGEDGPTSHNNPQWVGECNRIARLLGMDGFKASESKTRRVKEDGKSTVVRGCEPGSVDFSMVSGFPHLARQHFIGADYYRRKEPPFVTDSNVLQPQPAKPKPKPEPVKPTLAKVEPSKPDRLSEYLVLDDDDQQLGRVWQVAEKPKWRGYPSGFNEKQYSGNTKKEVVERIRRYKSL